MRLINTKTLKLVEFYGKDIPDYAILSHTWGYGEVTFQDWSNLDNCRGKDGWFKISRACEQAQKDHFDWLWVDTNCIDKTSSAELSEAINSMFAYYRNSNKCYAYLSDVDPKQSQYDFMKGDYEQHFCRSKWFTRGWTLQELLAPGWLVFYARDWSEIESGHRLARAISSATNIDPKYLLGWRSDSLSEASVAQKMAWLSSRSTTRVEDMAYCMLGIFEINMPLLYGEGWNAFTRLQEEIIKVSNDHTIFCWTWEKTVPYYWASFLAPYPATFRQSAGYFPTKSNLTRKKNFMMTNAGLSICLPVVQTFSYYLAILNAQSHETPTAENSEQHQFHVAIPIRGRLENNEDHDGDIIQPDIMERIPFPPAPCFIQPMWSLCKPKLLIQSRRSTLGPMDHKLLLPFQYGFLLIFDNVRVLDESRTRGKVENSRGAASYSQDGHQHAHSLKPFGHIFLTERISQSRRQDSIDTWPRGHFDPARAVVLLEQSSPNSGVLVRLGSGDGARILYLGIKISEHSGQPLRFCRFLSAGGWDPDYLSQYWKPDHTAHLSNTLQMQKDQFRNAEKSCPTDSLDGHSVVINKGIRTRSGLVFLTYIHHE